MLDVLVIAPHPDDAELGMGGTIAVMLGQGLRVGILDLTNGEPTPLGSPAIRARPLQRSASPGGRISGSQTAVSEPPSLPVGHLPA